MDTPRLFIKKSELSTRKTQAMYHQSWCFVFHFSDFLINKHGVSIKNYPQLLVTYAVFVYSLTKSTSSFFYTRENNPIVYFMCSLYLIPAYI
jgi:hypothetical protein